MRRRKNAVQDEAEERKSRDGDENDKIKKCAEKENRKDTEETKRVMLKEKKKRDENINGKNSGKGGRREREGRRKGIS